METFYGPYFDPEYDTLMERIYPPRVCIDNNGCQYCTLVQVDSANKHGILLEMVQVLTDLDLVISRSYISSDGGWFMDVFHVTDQLGNKLTDENLMLYIQQALCSNREGGRTAQDSSKVSLQRDIRPSHVSREHTALEMTATDSPGVLSEISAVLTELGCHLKAAAIWTHNTRAAMIIYLEEVIQEGSLALIQDQLENVIEAHNPVGERWTVRITSGSTTHTERRLHQMMAADQDYEVDSGCGCNDSDEVEIVKHRKDCWKTHATITTCKEKGYSVVNIKSRDRPKLLFDTVCTLTDMQYVVFHAAVSSKGSIAIQEYFIRHRDGCILDSERETHKVIQCLVAAIERRVSHGLRLELSTTNRVGLLSDVTRVFREHGLSISRAELGTQGERATGSFYVKDASGQELRPNLIESLRQEIGGNVRMRGKLFDWPQPSPSGASKSNNRGAEDRPRYSLGSLLWSHLERLSSNFGPIKL